MFHSRGFRGSRRRIGPRPIIHTYKKVLNFLNASFGAGFTNEQIVSGVDSVAIGQTSNIDGNVPTGSKIKFIELQFSVSNLVSSTAFINCSLQYVLSSQSTVNPDAVGGNTQRNQVLHQDLFSVGADQNSTHKFKFKIPPKFQRIREGMKWFLVWSTTASVNRSWQAIYKVEL